MGASCTKPWLHSCLLTARSHSLNAKLFPCFTCNVVSKWVAWLSTAKVGKVPTSPCSSAFHAQDQESLRVICLWGQCSCSAQCRDVDVCNTIVPLLSSSPTEVGPHCLYQFSFKKENLIWIYFKEHFKDGHRNRSTGMGEDWIRI